jgi:hypothetical protein
VADMQALYHFTAPRGNGNIGGIRTVGPSVEILWMSEQQSSLRAGPGASLHQSELPNRQPDCLRKTRLSPFTRSLRSAIMPRL